MSGGGGSHSRNGSAPGTGHSGAAAGNGRHPGRLDGRNGGGNGGHGAVGPRATLEAMSAGGVVYRRGKHGIEVVLVARPSERLWALPKGTPDPGETVEETAIREVCEETGLHVRIVDRLGDVRYWYTDRGGRRVNKVVHHYLMEAVGGDVSLHDHEHDLVDWFDIHEAEKRLTHRNQLHILARASDLIAKIPL